MTAISSPNYRWRVGEVEITRVLEFEAALFEPGRDSSRGVPEIIARHRTWLEPTLMNPMARRSCWHRGWHDVGIMLQDVRSASAIAPSPHEPCWLWNVSVTRVEVYSGSAEPEPDVREARCDCSQNALDG